ncbi:MAG TPA: hypothetical protein VLA34_04375 [Candidatus Krumholzibacterium sp.]|nr:hypothetical protein [Candidatus Krumholzibacterium sp.]
MMTKHAGSIVILLGLAAAGCSGTRQESIELKRYPLDSTEGVITSTGVYFDEDISSDGSGSLRIETAEPFTVRLFETGDLPVEGSRLTYRARMRTEDVKGQVYLEMWCSFPGMGEFFSRVLHAPLSGSNDWATQETFFILKAGEDPDNIRLNIAINGSGKVWIDDIVLSRTPLER